MIDGNKIKKRKFRHWKRKIDFPKTFPEFMRMIFIPKKCSGHYSEKRLFLTKLSVFIQCLFFVALPIFANIYLQSSLFNFSWDFEEISTVGYSATFFLTLYPLYLIEAFLVALIGQPYVSYVLYAAIFGIFGYANDLKIQYRMEPIYPEELKMIEEPALLKEMLGNNLLFYSLIFLIVILILILLIFFIRSTRKKWYIQIARICVLVLSFQGLQGVLAYNEPDNEYREALDKHLGWTPWHQIVMYQQNGFVNGFLYNIPGDSMDKPADYSETRINEIVSKYQGYQSPKIMNEEELPNIVYVMDESFSNPDHLNNIDFNENNPLDKFNQLSSETMSGYMLSSGYGGGTANIEFEALTGFSMEPLNPQIITPYTQVIPKRPEMPSIVSLLKSNQYLTTALHPYNTSMYKRREVYDKLGFDRFISEKEIRYKDTTGHSPYITDQSAFNETYDLLTESKDPQFIHLVTMQGHMPYDDKYDDTIFHAVGREEDKNISNYMEDIHSISESLDTFIRRLDSLPRRTLVVFWGDHLPGIYPDDIVGSNENWRMHETPFIMYDTKHELDQFPLAEATSTVYFPSILFKTSQLSYPPFYQMLLDMYQTMPAFEKSMYLYDNEWHDAKKTDAGILDEYYLIQYDILQGEQYSLKKGFFNSLMTNSKN